MKKRIGRGLLLGLAFFCLHLVASACDFTPFMAAAKSAESIFIGTINDVKKTGELTVTPRKILKGPALRKTAVDAKKFWNAGRNAELKKGVSYVFVLDKNALDTCTESLLEVSKNNTVNLSPQNTSLTGTVSLADLEQAVAVIQK